MPPVHRVVLAAAEAVPFAKTGGLGDAVGALAAALADTGLEVTVVLPAYGSIGPERHGLRRLPGSMQVPLGDRVESFSLLAGRFPATAALVVLVEHPGFFHRAGIYGDPGTGQEYPDAAARWIFFSRALLAALPRLGPAPDVLHLNDHHCALAAAYRAAGDDGTLAQTAIVLGLHNLGYQGAYDASQFPLTGLPGAFMAPFGPVEFWGRMNTLKAGLVFADAVITVSPTYAREIQESAEYGHGLEGVLRSRGDAVHGILNGIDERIWDPTRDPHLPATYGLNALSGKATCKRTLQEKSGLPVSTATPLFGMVSRLVEQKGVDLLLDGLDPILELPLQLVLLGRGDPAFEARLRERARARPERLAVHLDYDDALAHWIEAGSDFFLMPSRYEPCGLNQMYSMRYGTVPVVRHTGGLADTVQDWDGQNGTGFVFAPYTAPALLESVRRACRAFQNPAHLAALRRAGMQQDFSWRRSARRYRQVYDLAATQRRQGLAGTRR